MQAVVILGQSRGMLPFVGPRGRRPCMHHFDLHWERLINLTIKEDSFCFYYNRCISIPLYLLIKKGAFPQFFHPFIAEKIFFLSEVVLNSYAFVC